MDNPPRICGARLRSGEQCQLAALPDRTRCRLHGAAGGRPRGTPEHPNSRAARLEGRRRWVERMRKAKARGEIARFPGGRRQRDLPKLSKNPTIRRAQKILEAHVRTTDDVAVSAAAQDTKSSKLSAATDKSLDRVLAFLYQDIDPQVDPKLFTLQISAALSVISTQIRVDAAALIVSSSAPDGLDDAQKRQRARRMIEEAFAERTAPRNGGLDSSE